METKKDLKPINKKGQPHGYWETYYNNGQLNYKGSYVNGLKDGYWESYWPDGTLHAKGKFRNNAKVGLWIEVWIEGDKKVFYG